jgi:hypothetical protein
MISIISNKDDLIAIGFYKAFKILYKDVFFVVYPSQYHLMKDSKIIIINNFDHVENILINKNTKYILLNEHRSLEKKLKKLNIKYYNIFEYNNDFFYDDFEIKGKYMYLKDNIIIMPYMSIYTKNEIMFNYKNLLKKENYYFDKDKIIMIKNRNNKERKKYKKIPKLKIFNYINSLQEKNLIQDQNIFISFSDPNKFDYRSLSYISLGSLSITNSLLNNKHFDNIIDIKSISTNLDYKVKIEKFNSNFKKNIIENIQIIYNNYTFEKYVKVLDKILK